MISIFLNSRGRVLCLEELLDSIQFTTLNPSNIEMLIQIDIDDKNTVLFSKTHKKYSFKIEFFVGDRPTNLHTSINNLAKKSVGEFLFVLNDDTKIINYGWDQSLENINSKEVWYFRTIDNSCDKANDKLYSSFPILTRQAYNALGYFMSEKFVGLGADAHLYRLFKGVDRIQEIDIHIDHIFHRTVSDVCNPDETARYMRNNTWSNNINPWTIDMEEEIKKLMTNIKVTNDE